MGSEEVEIGESRLTKGYAINVPKAVRHVLRIQPGDRVVWLIRDGEVVLRRKSG